MKKIVTRLICLSLAIVLLLCSSCTTVKKKALFESPNYKFDDEMAYFYLYTVVDLLMQSNEQYFAYYGGAVDLSKPLKDQTITEGKTWYDYTMDMLPDYVESVVVMAEGALENNITISDEEKAIIKKWAENEDPKKYGNKVSINTLEKCRTINTLAEKYKNLVINSVNPTEDEYQKELTENMKNYTSVSYRYFAIEYEIESEETGAVTDADTAKASDTNDSEDEDLLKKSDAEAFAQALKNCKTDEEFATTLSQKLKEYYPKLTDDEIKEQVEDSLTENKEYTSGYDIFEWLFSSDRAANDIYYDHSTDGGYFVVCMLTKPMTEDMSKTIDVRHILITSKMHGSDENAKSKADEILNKINESENKLSTIDLLSLEYSEDPGSQFNGGIYKNVSEGDMVTEFNDWCFDKARVSGDTAVVKTSYGYHVMYFVGDGLTATKGKILSALQENNYNETYKALSEKITFEANEADLSLLDA